VHHLGQTRSAVRPDHVLQTPDTFVRAPLPGMRDATAIVHIAPAQGARFTQYTVEFASGGATGPAVDQRFIYVLDGELRFGDETLRKDGYAYIPAGGEIEIEAASAARAAVIEKPYEALPGVFPSDILIGSESRIAPQLLGGDSGLEVRMLLPDQPPFDFAVNTMVYQPGATLPMVEIHVMEHGLLMLEGGGVYRLGEHWYFVGAGDFIWMAPSCPQWFGALGKTPAKYLIYKDWNRHPLRTLR